MEIKEPGSQTAELTLVQSTGIHCTSLKLHQPLSNPRNDEGAAQSTGKNCRIVPQRNNPLLPRDAQRMQIDRACCPCLHCMRTQLDLDGHVQCSCCFLSQKVRSLASI